MLDLYDFQREIDHNGVLSHNKFFVRIDPNTNLTPANDVNMLRTLSLRATSASFPGIHLMTKDDITRYGYGPVEKTPYNAQFSDANISFIVDVRGKVYSFWYKWLRFIVACDSSDSMFRTIGDPSVGGPIDTTSGPYEAAYKDDYVADITISPTSELHNKSMDCILYRAHPIAIHEIQLDASAQNSPVLLQIALAYRDHKIVNHSEKTGSVFVQ
jgi:hypothetical protein